jgi:hypothetical protein
MLGNAHFYNRTIRKIVVAFGTMFNDIHLVRYNKAGTVEQQHIKVPLNWGSKEKYLTRITSDPTLTKSIATVVPRMSFEMTGMSYDAQRKQVTTQRNFAKGTAAGTLKSQYVPVPYNFDFTLSIYVRNTEDGTQILEQILPFFTPDFTVSLDFIPEMSRKYDMPVILNSVDSSVDYEGDFMNTRLIIWTLNFTAKAAIFPPVKGNNGSAIKYITKVNGNISELVGSLELQKVYVDKANGSGVLQIGETFHAANNTISGTIQYYSNSNSGIVIVQNISKRLSANDVIRGDTTNASYKVKDIGLSKVIELNILTEPDPLGSEPDDEYGFSQTITEFPDTL